ncbi:MAG: PD-(D/E)XK nuclease family protein [Bacteroidales bacterium]|nr:PD-(D/E)XK nuclease family protein [Bacteroidales bacterium]
MPAFINQLTETILKKYTNSLQDLLIVFPNKRAGLFFKKAIMEQLTQSSLLPRFQTIEEAFESWSDFSLADPLTVQFELMSIKASQNKNDSLALTDFAGLASQMAEDFNEIDHQLVDVATLFDFLKEAKALEMWHPDGSPLTDSEKRYIFFYRQLKDDYHKLNENLSSKGLAYGGRIARDLAGLEISILLEQIDAQKVIFAGFNAFTKAEASIVKRLLLEEKAAIYWDLDRYYFEPQFFGLHEAGNAIRKFLQDIKNQQEIHFLSDDLLHREYHFVLHAVQGDVLQAKALGNELRNNPDPTAAVVLGDENLLLPVMNSIPDNYEQFNVTLGFPFNKSAGYQFIRLYLEFHAALQQSAEKEIYLKPLLSLLSHEFNQSILDQTDKEALLEWRLNLIRSGIKFSDKNTLLNSTENETLKTYLKSILTPIEGNSANQISVINSFLNLITSFLVEREDKGSAFLINQLNLAERIFNKLAQLFPDLLPETNSLTITAIFIRIAGAQKVPFSGEPLQGLQIMGLLETRNLSFRNLHLLSLNEDILPRKQLSHSLIPADIRRSFELPAFTEKQAVTAYHFFRLIQHAENIHLYYNTEAGDFGSGEASRYVRQIIHELAVVNSKVKITESNFSLGNTQAAFTEEINIPKNEKVLAQLFQKAASGFSPSSLAHYLECPLKFYFSDVLRLRATEQFDESIKYNELGTIVHETLEILYKPYIGQNLNEKILDSIIKASHEVLENCIRRLIPGGLADQGNSLITKEVAHHLVNNFLKREKEILNPSEPINIKGLESKLESIFIIQGQPVKLKGTIDRIDQKGNNFRLIDYKTGQVKPDQLKIKNWEDLLEKKKTKALQLALYWLLINRSDFAFAKANFSCGILSLQKPRSGLMTLQLPEKDLETSEAIPQIEEKLIELIEDILNEGISIHQTEDQAYCKNCDFASICNR